VASLGQWLKLGFLGGAEIDGKTAVCHPRRRLSSFSSHELIARRMLYQNRLTDKYSQGS
jgi:hypothetical protein